ncbi:translocation/assembly module TamB domain-containing protein [Dawidia soli]|uniref:Translocation/assembly module TamB domain-containing protein n=1 Tax=Dawidia soli TaxID=2782352 RepID=A0AAP2DA77_9BACT|nr:translocation/assembly module TamB domain-containing protein [Dawidia soli]MBT1687341.1 translocation/assembly module TamB domain-containing protein [Dawidia soli]
MNLQVIKNRIRKILVYSVTAVLFLFISAFLVLQMPPVQNWLVSRLLKDFTQVTGFPTTVTGFRMLWFDRLELTGVNLYDTEQNRMIGAKEILINFKLLQLLHQQDINIDGIYVDSAHVFLTMIQESDTARNLNINVFIDRINEKFSSGSSGGGTGRTPRVNIGEAFLNRSQLTYIDQDSDTVPQGFDYHHFSLAVDEGHLNSFVVLGDTTEFYVRTLIAQDQKTQFKVKQLSTFFRLSQAGMEFTGLNVQAGNSTVSDTVLFRYQGHRALSHFVDEVTVHAHLTNTVIEPEDLELFAPGVRRLGQPLTVSGTFNGRVNKFKYTQMEVDIGRSRLTGSLEMEGLPNINETFIVLNLRNSTLDPNDIAFLFNEQTLARLRPMGDLAMHGQFLGYPNDFVANGTFSGRLGTIRSDINLKVNEEDINRSVYKGRVSLINFDLGTYLEDTTMYQHVSLDGQIAGAGLTQKTADFQLNGRVSSIGVNKYNYTNIRTDARFASGLFRGLIEINDPNLELTARGSIDLREGRNQIRIRARLDTAYLHKLNLSRDTLFLHARVAADIQGLTLDSLRGTADVTDLILDYNQERLKLDHVLVDAQRDQGMRSFKVQSTLADVEARGNYNFSDISYDIQTLIKEVSLNIRNDQREIAEYYRLKTYKPKSYEAQIAINLKDIRPINDLLNLNLSLARNTRIDGRFTSGRTTIINLYTAFDSLEYQGKVFINTDIELTTSKIADSTSVLSMLTVNSERQILSKNLKTKNLLAEAIWNKNHIDFGLDADHDGKNNYVRLKGGVDFLRDSTVVTMAPSDVKILERNWSFMPRNYVAIRGSDWTFHDLALENAEQYLRVNGKISKDPNEILSLNVHNLDLSLLDVLTDLKFRGIAEAQVDVSHYYQEPTFQNTLHVKDFTINDFLVGDISTQNRWDTTERRFDINLFVDRSQSRIVNLTGHYTPGLADSPLNLSARLEKANLKIAEPFLGEIFSQIGGTVSGDFRITGTLNDPAIRGEGKAEDGQIMINYLKTMYRFTGIIGLTPTSLYFKDIELADVLRNKARLNGAINHHSFSDMTINLDARFRNFQVLNTAHKDNSLFYGQAYATGDLNFNGPLSNLRITSTARTEKNTHIYIPLSGSSSSVDKKEFISFVNFKDTTFTKKIEGNLSNRVNLTGLAFDLNLDVTPDAYCEIIFDQKSGDIIRGRGNGDLKLQLDTKGEFNMFGPFEFTEGWYNFTLYDIINKEFTVKKGSRITWYGNPYQGTVEIDASYNQMASLAPLITMKDQSAGTSPQLQRKYPVQVLLRLDGPMMSPEINFDITAKDLPKNVQTESGNAVNLDLEFTAFKNKLDEQELKRQVFSLIVLRRFSPPESFDASGSVVNSLSELLSNQLSHWMSQVDEDLVVDVDLGSMDQETFNTFQLRLSYTFLNGRLRVTGDGTFNNTSNSPNGGTTPGTQTNPSSVAGDWTVDYMLTADGKLRVKMYSRTNVNPVLSSVNTNQNSITTGASIIHTQSFNELRDLWQTARKRRRQREEERQNGNRDAIKEDDDNDPAGTE